MKRNDEPENSIVHKAVAGAEMAINPENGADLFRLVLDGKEIIKPGGQNEAENPWLFPFPNRLKHGAYDFEGKKYSFEINDDNGLQNALHGFVRTKPFSITEQGKNDQEAWITLNYTDAGKFESYPFPFQMSISYRLSVQELKVEVKLVNIGCTNIPAGLGWHPYFDLPLGKDKAEIQLPLCEEIEVDKTMIPTGKKFHSTRFDVFRNLKGIDLDTCFELNDKGKTHLVRLRSGNDHEIRLWQDGDYGFIQIYTPADGQSIAIEPMTCGIDAFNTGEGLRILASGESWEVSCGVGLG